MKSVVLLISLVHLLLAFSSSCSARTIPNQVLQVVRDTNGEILRSDARYFVVSAIRGAGGGGVRRGPTFVAENDAGDANFVCPFQVVQSPLDVDKGMPVFFKPKAPKQVEITESTSLNINFYIDNPTGICNNTVWEVEGYPGGTDQSPLFLSTNGVIGNPLQVATWFQIKKFHEFAYKLVFCPYKETFCNDIGIELSYGERRLAVRTDRIFPVVFVKDTNYGINSII